MILHASFLRTAVIAAALALPLAACNAPQPDEQEAASAQAQAAAEHAATPTPEASPQPPPAGSCEAAQVQGLVGQTVSDALAEQARIDAGASTVRILRPDQPVTLEFDGNRLNIEVDTASAITGVRCG